MKYKPFIVTEYNDLQPDKNVTLNSDMGRIYIRVGSLDICIMQEDQGLGVIIDVFDDPEIHEDPITMTVWYRDEEDEEDEEDEKTKEHEQND